MIKLGNTEINKIYLGNTEIKKAYLGNTIVYDKTVVSNGLLNGLVSYYKMDTNGSFLDAHGTNNGTINGASYTASGKINGGYSFDGVNDYIDLGNNFNYDGSTPFSISSWFNLDITTNNQMLIGKQLISGSFGGYILWLQTNGSASRLNLSLVSNDSTFGVIEKVTAYSILSPSLWYNLAFTYDGSKTAAGLKLYINGIESSLTTNSDTLGTKSINTSTSFNIGARNNGNLPTDGLIDETGIYNRVLTQTDITTLYNGGAGLSYDNFTT